MPVRSRRGLVARLLPAVCVALAMSASLCARAGARDSAMRFDIPASDLATALIRFSEQAHLQVIGKAEQLRAWSTPGLRGTYTIAQALEALLARTDLRYQFSPGSSVVAIGRFPQLIVPRAPPAEPGTLRSPEGRGAFQSPPVASAPTAPTSLPEVLVTAERRVTNLQITPIAITAISGNELQQRHLNTVSDLQTTVPGFQNDDEGGFFNSINIRGIGESFISPTIATGVAVFRDNLLMSESIAQDEPLFDILDVEVLEGPQGTLVGANSTAGAVVINSASPDFAGLHGFILASLATYSDTRWQGAINLPFTDAIAARFAFSDEQRGSFSRDIGATLNGYFVDTTGALRPLLQGTPAQSEPIIDPGHLLSRQARLSLRWRPTDSFEALGKVEYSSIDYGGQPGQPDPYTYTTLFGYGPPASSGAPPAGCLYIPGTTFTGTQLSCPTPGVTAHSQYYYPGETPRVLDYYGTAWEHNELQTRHGPELRYTLANGIVLRSMSGLVHIRINRENNLTYGPQNGGQFYDEIGPNDDYMSEELNFISPVNGRLDWIAGAYWNYRDTPVNLQQQLVPAPYQPGELPSALSYLATASVNRMAAVFGQINRRLGRTLQLQFGARQNWDNNFTVQSVNVAQPGATLSSPYGTGLYAINYAGNTPISYRVLAPINAGGTRYRDSVTTGKIDLNWTPVPGQNFYVFYARGFKTGGVNAQSTDHPTFNPEYLNDYEIGWKGRLADGHVLTQINAYYYDYRNMQYQLFDAQANNDTQTGSYVANLSPSSVYGLEVAAQSRFGGLGVSIAFDYNQSALGAVVTLPQYALPPGFGNPITHPQCLAGHSYAAGTQCFDYTPYLVNVTGEANPFSPPITANVSVDYRFRLGNGTVDPRVIFSHTDRQYDSIFQNSYNAFQARNLLSASVDWIAGPWDTQLYVTNLTDQTYIIDGGDIGFGTPEFYGPPRQLGLQMTRRF
jgi:iron complex outermembrane receptor protein